MAQYQQPGAQAGAYQPQGITDWGPVPINTTCTNCKKSITTIPQRQVGTGTWVWCTLLCFFVGCPLNYLPFCIDGCKDIAHMCPSCSTIVGRKDVC